MHGVLLVNLGTPDSTSESDVKRYLSEFLLDGRVIDVPWLQRNLLVRGAIIPNRYKASAAAYESIWTEEGSPLLVNSEKIATKLQERLGLEYRVVLAMRYQNPSMKRGLKMLEGCEKLTVIPLFPQYASATTGSIIELLFEQMKTFKTFPEMHICNSFPTNPGFIQAAAKRAPDLDEYDVVMSFHGLPVRQLESSCLKDNCCKRNNQCYRSQCFATAKAIGEELGRLDYHVSFQSRLGKEPWLEPFTSDVLRSLAQSGKGKVAVFCPSFVCDCLETLEEIAIQYKEEFIQAGGDELLCVPCVNDHDLFIEGLAKLIYPFTPSTSHVCSSLNKRASAV